MKVIYIAGPSIGDKSWSVDNVLRAVLEVTKVGAMPLSRFLQRQGTDEFWLSGTLQLLRRCDAILLVYGWTEASRALAEKAVAVLLGIPVFYQCGCGKCGYSFDAGGETLGDVLGQPSASTSSEALAE